MNYHTFDLTISSAGIPHQYLLFAQTTTQGEADGRTSFSVHQGEFGKFLQAYQNRNIVFDDLKKFGSLLFNTFFISEIRTLWHFALGETLTKNDVGIRLRLRLLVPELGSLPWEVLYDSERQLFLAASLETPLSRYINLPEPIKELACPEHINLLAIIPQNSGLDVKPEIKVLQNMQIQLKDILSIDFLPGSATTDAIRAALREKEYHVIHYAGHGSFDGFVANIHLDGEGQETHLLAAEPFAHFFTDYPWVRLVFLNACQGAATSSFEALLGLAPQLVLRGVPAVIAMQNPIGNKDAILCAKELYAALSSPRNGGQIEVAVSSARKALLQENPQMPAFTNPVLFLRAQDGNLWQTKEMKSTGKDKKSWLERWLLWLTLAATSVGLIVGLLDLPTKITETFQKQDEKKQIVTSRLRGCVKGSADGKPLEGVLVEIRDLPQDTIFSTMTTSDGGFSLDKIPLAIGEKVRVYYSKANYISWNEYITLPGPANIKLEKIK